MDEYPGRIPDLFASLWNSLAPHIGTLLSEPWIGGQAREAVHIAQELGRTDDGTVSSTLRSYLEGERPTGWVCEVGDPLQRKFVVAQSIDSFFEDIHPRSAFDPSRPHLKGLRSIDSFRLANGFWGQTELGTVVPKGPLRTADEFALPPTGARGGGDVLDDQFAFITLLPRTFVGERYTIDVRLLGALEAAVPAKRNGTGLRVGFAPIAEGPGDLKFTVSSRSFQDFIDVTVEDEELLTSRANAALTQLSDSGVHIVVMPELCLTDRILAGVSDTLRELSGTGHSSIELVVAGTRLTHDSGDPVYNECNVFNGSGKILWRQRKLHHWAMNARTAEMLGLPPAPARRGYRENIGTADHLLVRDIPRLGRAAVLICEDLNQEAPLISACQKLRPDWIFCPILDDSIRPRRWVHNGASQISGRYGARVIVGNSMTISARNARGGTAATSAGCGVGLVTDGAYPGRFRLEEVAFSTRPAPSAITVIVDWDPIRWPQ